MSSAAAVKTAASLLANPGLISSEPAQHSPGTQGKHAGDRLVLDEEATAATHGREWHQQQRQQQRDEPCGGASTSAQAAPCRQKEHAGHVKFAAERAGHVMFAGTGSSSSSSARDVADAAEQEEAQLQQQQHRWHNGFDEGPAEAKAAARGPEGAAHAAILGRLRKAGFAEGTDAHGSGSSSSNRLAVLGSAAASAHTGSIKFQEPAEDANGPGLKSGHTTDRSHASAGAAAGAAVASSGFSASLKGLFGGASAKLLGSLIGRSSNSSSRSNDGGDEEEELWFTSLDDFKPICHMLHRGRYMTAYFACANKTGQHFLLKKFDKHKMVPAEERGVRRSIAFSELLHHPNLVKCMGQWEADDTIFVVEEYVGKGDIFNDCISHPEKYTERHVAIGLVKPLLTALSHLHANNIMHRSVLPENIYMGIDDVLRLGHLTLAVDQLSDRPKSRTALLDYMSPEMLSVKLHNEHELALLADDDSSSSCSHGSDGALSAGGSAHWEPAAAQHQQHQQHQQQPGDVVPHSQLALLGRAEEPARAAAAAVGQQQLTEQHGTKNSSTSAAASQQLHVQQQQRHYSSGSSGGGQLQQPAQLDSSCLASPDAAAAPEAAASAASGGSRRWHCGRAEAGKAAWENLDYYDEKVDVWQVGCMVHELLCGSMPFEVESKLDSAGLALWADIQQPPGSLAPDCVAFVQAALTKDPRMRPSAEQLLGHPWLARCEAGQPWRDPAELEAARRAAELVTVWGWLCHRSRQAVAAVSGVMRGVHWQGHMARVQPAAGEADGEPEEEAADGPVGGQHGGAAGTVVAFSTNTCGTGSNAAAAAAGLTQQPGAFQQQQLSIRQLQPSPSKQKQQQQQPGGIASYSKQPVPPLQLTAEVLGALDRGWAAESGFNAACVVFTTTNAPGAAAGSGAVTSASPGAKGAAVGAGTSFAMQRALAATGEGGDW